MHLPFLFLLFKKTRTQKFVETKDINASFSDTRNLFFFFKFFHNSNTPTITVLLQPLFYLKKILFYFTTLNIPSTIWSVVQSRNTFFFLANIFLKIQEINKILNHDENTGILRKHLHHKFVFSCCLFHTYDWRYTSKIQFRFQFCSHS